MHTYGVWLSDSQYLNPFEARSGDLTEGRSVKCGGSGRSCLNSLDLALPGCCQCQLPTSLTASTLRI